MSNRVIEFGEFRLDFLTVYRGNNERVNLPQQTLGVLQVLLDHSLRHGNVGLESEALRQKAWPGIAVDKNNLHQQIAFLRRELGAEAIESTTGPRGYRLTLPVRIAGQPQAVRWRAISVVPFVCQPGFFRDEERLRLAGFHLALGVIHHLRQLTSLEIREITAEHLFPGWQPQSAQIAKAQRTDLVLSGHLMAGNHDGAEDELRVQLVEAESANVLWSGKYSVQATDTNSIEHDIAWQVAARLGYSIDDDAKKLSKLPNPAAVAHYRKARFMVAAQQVPPQVVYDEFMAAVSLDPNYAEAWAGIAANWLMRSGYNWSEVAPNEALPKALAAIQHSLELDPHCGEAHLALALVAMAWQWDWERCEKHVQLAIRSIPDDVSVNVLYGRLLCTLNRFDEAIEQTERGIAVGGYIPMIMAMAAWNYYLMGQHERAIKLCQETIEKLPQFPVTWAILAFPQEALGQWEAAVASCQEAIRYGERLVSYGTLGCALGKLGRRAEAEQALQQLADRHQQLYTSPYHSALIHAGLGDNAEALRWLELAYDDRSEWLTHLLQDARLRELRTQPTFRDLAKRVGVLLD